MGPSIILDKSALQSLSLHEIGALNRYYTHNIAPILIVEILGDLKKKSSMELSQKKVAELAQKVSPSASNISAHYRDLITSSLMGHTVPMDGRILLPGGHDIETPDGQRGVVYENTPEETALIRWRQLKFSEAETIMADRWRSSTRSFDLEQFKQNLAKIVPKNSSISDPKSIFSLVQEALSQDSFQTDLLKFLIVEFNIDFSLAQRIFYRWETEGLNALPTFAPYAYYCASVAIYFYIGLIHNVIPTRPTNRVDLEYLYYMPFCDAFCSGDKFHDLTAPMFLRPSQRYFRRDQLKTDLAMLSDDLHEHGPAGIDRKPSESITAALWSDLNFGKMTNHGWISPEQSSTKEDSSLVDFIKSRSNGRDITADSIVPGEEDFIIKKTTILSSDPCPCGSRRTFEECHGRNIVEKMRKKSEQAGQSDVPIADDQDPGSKAQ